MEKMPEAVEAENALIGALLHDNLTYEQVADFLKTEHFFDPINQRIYKCIVYCIQKGQLASPITIWPFFSDDEVVKKRGGQEYLKNISNSIFSLSYVGDYGKQILDAHIRREIIRIGNQMLAKAYNFDIEKDAFQNIEEAENGLFGLSSATQGGSRVVSFGNILSSVMTSAKIAAAQDNHVVGIPTGLIDLDKHMGGLHKSDLLILAGRPSMGKTALATNIAFSAAKFHGKPVAFFSLEMSSEQLAMRILGPEANISPDKIRRGMISQSEMNALVSEAKKLSSVPLLIDDTPALTIAGLRTRARRLYRQEGIGLIVIDYLQLLTGGGIAENRVQELSFITRSLKALAKELNIPVLALSQLSRAVEQRDDKRPQLADLRESGSIEQDADVVMFVFREAYYESRKKPPEGSPKMHAWQENMNRIHNTAELIIAKQRHGPIRNITLHYEDTFTKFGNYISEDAFVD
jgi:replicative DNA helicase